jgi:hypothetical protein
LLRALSAASGAGKQVISMPMINLADEIPPCPQWFCDAMDEYKAGLAAHAPARREAVQNLTAKGYSTREIADIVGVSHVTVADDVKNLKAIDAAAQRREGGAGIPAPPINKDIPRRQRRPSIGRMIAAERGGKNVTSITTPDGVTLHFGKGESTEASNPWLDDLNKVTKQ